MAHKSSPHKGTHSDTPSARETAEAIHHADRRILDRMLFFSDAVFAIVLTLLVLELRPPEEMAAGPVTVGNVLAPMAPHFIAFINSFLLVGLWWFVHMRITRPLLKFDWPVAILNFFFLLSVTLIPFASAVLSSRVQSGAVWQIYWAVNAGSSTTLALLSWISTRGRGRLVGGTTTAIRLVVAGRTLSPALCFVTGIWLAAHGYIGLAQYAWVPIPLFMIVMGWLQRRVTRPRTGRSRS